MATAGKPGAHGKGSSSGTAGKSGVGAAGTAGSGTPGTSAKGTAGANGTSSTPGKAGTPSASTPNSANSKPVITPAQRDKMIAKMNATAQMLASAKVVEVKKPVVPATARRAARRAKEEELRAKAKKGKR